MFIIIWSFGKKITMLNKNSEKSIYYKRYKIKNFNSSFIFQKKYLKRNYSTLSCNKLAPYLAGLIEGVGHIAVHNENFKSKIFRPKIIITFNENDKPLAEKISALLKVGKVIPKKGGCVILQILGKDEVLKIINLINGYMRTPKIEALHRAIT